MQGEGLNGIIHDDSKFVTVGFEGTILTSSFDPTEIIEHSGFVNNKNFRVLCNKNRLTLVVPNNLRGNLKYQIFDIAGRKINSATLPVSQSKVSLPVSNIAMGMYIISISCNDGKKIRMPLIAW